MAEELQKADIRLALSEGIGAVHLDVCKCIGPGGSINDGHVLTEKRSWKLLARTAHSVDQAEWVGRQCIATPRDMLVWARQHERVTVKTTGHLG